MDWMAWISCHQDGGGSDMGSQVLALEARVYIGGSRFKTVR